MDRITTFKLHWYDCGLSYGYDVVYEEITVNRNRNKLVFVQYNGFRDEVGSEEIKLNKADVQIFFEFLETNEAKWKTDYSVRVCDGWSWELRMGHSSHRIKKIYGTVEYPPKGKRIEKYIRSFIKKGKSLIHPRMFGCGCLDQ